MIGTRMRLDLDRYAARQPLHSDDDHRMPPVWLCVAILIAYAGLIGVGLWAIVRMFWS